ncbi:hypothetical protein LTR37_001640 [Vermiconidia calcicola]|uniref:Uncharacterized protein n=1 Tax=Vermiconidia calcicola TaxID=1690605 RepID=A0ACC3NVA3_9PEZI|nr:hypothetical protein LTR37_001640 [Vermiconidia calcicola]
MDRALVFIKEGNSYVQVSPPNLTKEKLMLFSNYAAEQLKSVSRDVALSPQITLPHSAANRDAAINICKWIADNDINNPTALTLTALGLEVFDEVVYVHQTANCMGLNRQFRGDDVRTAIFEYFGQSPLAVIEFTMVLELLSFDSGLCKSAKHAVMHGVVKGGSNVPPEMEKIEEYCKTHGFWDEMLAIEQEIREKHAQRDAEELAKWADPRVPRIFLRGARGP